MGDVKGKALVDTLCDTLVEVVAKTITDTVTALEAEAPVKTEDDSVAGMEGYAVVVALNKIKACRGGGRDTKRHTGQCKGQDTSSCSG